MNRDLRLVSLALLFWGFGEGLFLFIQPLYIERLGANPVQIGSALSGVRNSSTDVGLCMVCVQLNGLTESGNGRVKIAPVSVGKPLIEIDQFIARL